jgi:superkiller protein 3
VAPFNPELRVALGTALRSRNETTEGMEQLRLAAGLKATPAGLSPASAGARPAQVRQDTELAAALVTQGRLEEAIRQYEAALAIEPRSETAHAGLGEALSKQGRFEEAAKQFTQALEANPSCEPVRVQLGIAWARQGKVDEAVAAFTEALRLQPDDADAHNGLGNTLAQQGKYAEAVRQFEEAVRLHPDHAAAHNNLAISCNKLGRTAEAIAHYREAIRLQPYSLQAYNNLAWMLAAFPDAQFRNGPEAVRLATRACELSKYQNPLVLATLAAAYGETGQFPVAVSFVEQAQKLASGSPQALAARLSAMLEAFQAGRAYHAE